jgi:hypothetical protein
MKRARTYATAGAFRRALEERLRRTALTEHVDLNRREWRPKSFHPHHQDSKALKKSPRHPQEGAVFAVAMGRPAARLQLCREPCVRSRGTSINCFAVLASRYRRS